MHTKKRIGAAVMAGAMLFAGLSGTASAALQAVGPTDPVTTVPGWYSDGTGLALQPCLAQNGMCVLTAPFDPLVTFPPAPITTTGPISDLNLPAEAFYYLADSTMNVGPTLSAKAILRLAVEFSFLTGVTPNQGITFARINLQRMVSGLTPNSVFTVTHPYGSFTFSSDATGASVPSGISKTAAYRTNDPVAPAPGVYFPPDLAGTTTTHIGPFLIPTTGLVVDPVSGKTFIGDHRIAVPVTGSPQGNNFFRIDGPDIGGPGVNTIQTPLFSLAGQVFSGTVQSPMTIDRSTYSRDATSGQIDVFATALPTATMTLSGVGIPTTVMTQDPINPGKFSAHVPLPSSALPTSVVIADSLDTPAPLPHPVTLIDAVTISHSTYDPVARAMTVVASSSDKLAPGPTLTAPGYLPPNTLDATGKLVIPLLVEPLNVSIASSAGGTATSPVNMFTPAPAPAAVADAATTLPGTPVTIPVLANDTIAAPGVINPASVVISTPPLNGFAIANLNGTVTYIPIGTFSGPVSFSYTVANTQGVASNAGTVNVTVSAPAPAPVAVADSASTTAGTAVTIPVLANDTIALPGVISPSSVAIVSPPLNGTAVANPVGTVTFTPAAGFTGTTAFAYEVSNTAGTASNPTIVTVTVNAAAAAPAPVAVADTASTLAGSAVTIPVLANDTIAAPGVINGGSIVITSAPVGGTAVANLTGGVTFTPAAGFTGTTSFAYTVANTQGLASAPATVTVTVTPVVVAPAPAPVAVADTATTTAGTAVTIPVLANDTIAAPGVINAASVVITSAPLNGTAVVNPTGSISFTPAAGFTGTTSFTYTVSNTQGLASNAATVTVTVNAAVTETVRATVAEYVVSKGSWNVQGTTTNATTHAMTVKLAGVVAGAPCNADGRVIGTANATGGKYQLAITGAIGGLLDPTTTNCNSVVVQSSLGGVSTSLPFALK